MKVKWCKHGKDKLAEVVRLYRSGLSISQTAAASGLSVNVVWGMMKYRKVKTRSQGTAIKMAICSGTFTGKRKYASGSEHFNWSGGRRVDKNGYIRLWAGSGKNVLEHRLVAERRLGRKLRRGEVVHHVNGNKKDNRPGNLRVMTISEHAKEHARARKKKAS